MYKFLMAGAVCILSVGALAQTNSFTGFTSGNMVVSRSVYAGDATTVTVGQALPPLCPTTATCGTAKATDNGAGPAASGTGNVWNNNKVDGSFGITSPIFLDQITPAGTLVSTLPVPANLVTTSFPSKSELALNLSSDGNSITFMGYVAPPNTLDVSNSNTPAVYDPTNPAGTSYYRAVAQVSASGLIRVTPTNSYSGNNGRAAILANGLYYMAGNSNNGGGTPANVVASAGAQMAAPGQLPSTPPTPIGSFSITQINDPATGKPYAADKLGKDNNFRGLTIFNNTLYVTKGSGGNGINTVYQVGAAGSLPTQANAATAPISILPGFPTTLAKNADAANPFGIWFATANTLYVADEGDGTAANAATSKIAGLQKWTLVNGTWTLAYVMQNGLNLGQPYAVNGYPTALNPATDGLRNITGRVNADGSVTVWGVTSTISANGDQGADPNKLVSINDILANTSATVAANQQFTTVRSAAAGEVLRGVSFAPTGGFFSTPSVPLVISAANSGATSIAPGSLATAGGKNLATGTASGATPLPTTLSGTTVSIVDAAGKSFAAAIVYVSPTQVNFQVPAAVSPGTAQLTITSGDGTPSATPVSIASPAPGVFTLNGSGLAAANALLVSADGKQTQVPLYTANATGAVSAAPISLGTATDRAYLILYGTGISGGATGSVKVSIGGLDVPVLYAGPQGSFAGLDQINVQIPSSLAGKGTVLIQVTAGGIAANPVQVVIK